MARTQQRTLPFLLADRYRVTQRLGTGQSSEVYAAHDKRMGRSCAIKLLRMDLAIDDGSQRERLEREAHALANLKHRAIVSVFDVETDGDEAWIVLELVDGTSLDQVGVLTPNDAASVMVQIASALETAHHQGILHRDIKPANILRSSDGTVKLADFGIAMLAAAGPGLTLAGTPIGTPSYMPPEQAEGLIGQFSPASDIYAMGATLYALLTGRPPFPVGDDHSVEATLKEVINARIVSPSVLNTDIPETLEAICLKCLARCPQDRFQSADELRQVLQQFIDGEPVQLSRRTSLKHLATTGVVAAGFLATGVVWWQKQNEDRGLPEQKSPDELTGDSTSQSPQSKTLSTADDTTAARTPLPDGPPGLVGTLAGHSQFLMSLTFSPDGRTIVSSSQDQTVRFWDIQLQRELRQTHADDSAWVIDTQFSHDGKLLLTGSSHGVPPKVRTIDGTTGDVVREFHGCDERELVLSVDFSKDSAWIAVVSVNQKIRKATARVWRTNDSQPVFEVDCGEEDAFAAVRFLPDSDKLLISTSNSDFGTRLFDVNAQHEINAYHDSRNHTRDIAVSSDGSFFCIFSSSLLRFFKVPERQSFKTIQFRWNGGSFLTPDNRHLIVSSGKWIRILDVQSKTVVHEQ